MKIARRQMDEVYEIEEAEGISVDPDE